MTNSLKGSKFNFLEAPIMMFLSVGHRSLDSGSQAGIMGVGEVVLRLRLSLSILSRAQRLSSPGDRHGRKQRASQGKN